MSVAIPYEWLSQIPRSVLTEESPFAGSQHLFPWDQFGAVFAKMFQIESFKIVPSYWRRRSEDDLYEGYNGRLLPLYIELAGLKGDAAFIMSEEEIDRFMSALLTRDVSVSTSIDPDYRHGFYQFIALEVFHLFVKLDYLKANLPHLVEKNELPKVASFCQDFSMDVNGVVFQARVILSDDLIASWKEAQAENPLKPVLSTEVADKIQVIVHLEAGSVHLKIEEWNKIALGDCLLLDKCSLDDQGEKGRVMMTLNGKPLYRAKVKDGSIKILETPFFHEIDTNIAQQQQEEAPMGNTFDDEFTDFDEEFTEFDEHAEEHTTEQAVKAPVEEKAEKPLPVQEEKEKATVVESPLSGKPVPLVDIPLTVVVEVGRIQISVGKLMALEPGNLLDLNVHPENGVDLVINGNVVGKGELLKIGDVLGVRILEKV